MRAHAGSRSVVVAVVCSAALERTTARNLTSRQTHAMGPSWRCVVEHDIVNFVSLAVVNGVLLSDGACMCCPSDVNQQAKGVSAVCWDFICSPIQLAYCTSFDGFPTMRD